jgi:hypothetical protein
MNVSLSRSQQAAACGLLLAGAFTVAQGDARLSSFTPLSKSDAAAANGAALLTFGSPGLDASFHFSGEASALENPQRKQISIFADSSTVDVATGIAVGDVLEGKSRMAIDGDGNVYIVTGGRGGINDTVWFAVDLNNDGDLKDAGEGLARWAVNGIPGTEITHLSFDAQDKSRASLTLHDSASQTDWVVEVFAENANAGKDSSIIRPPQFVGTDASIDKPPQSVRISSSIIKPEQMSGTDASITKPPQSIGISSSIIKPEQMSGTDASITKPPQSIRIGSSIIKPEQMSGTDSSITKPPQSVRTDSSVIKPE